MNHSSQPETRALVTFRLDRQICALPIEPIVQIIEMVTITPIPQANRSVEGMINVRSVVVPVINLRRHLGMPEAGLQLNTPAILVQVGEQMIGLMVDQVLDVLTLTADQVACPADILPGELGDIPILDGLAQTPQGMVLLFDLEHLLAFNGSCELDRALAALSTAEAPSNDVALPQPDDQDVVPDTAVLVEVQA